MNKYTIVFVFCILVSCINDKTSYDTKVTNYIDSIYEVSRPVLLQTFENISVDEYYMRDTTNGKWKIWIYADSINKYCSTEELSDLARSHYSIAVRYVAFKLLLKRDSHMAVNYLISDIDNTDSICAVRLDEGFSESLSSLRVELAQNRKLYNISVEDSIAVDNAVLKSKNKNSIKYYRSLVRKLSRSTRRN